MEFLFGNYTSQYFANIYLNELDKFVKHTLKLKYYIRYMDDFIIFSDTKNEAISIKKTIEDFLKSNLQLSLNEKSGIYPNKMGINFCGYRIFLTHKLLRNSSKTKIKNKVKYWNKLYAKNKLDMAKAMQSFNSWLGHSSHCNSYKLQNRIINKCNFIYSNFTYSTIEKNLISDMKNYNNS